MTEDSGGHEQCARDSRGGDFEIGSAGERRADAHKNIPGPECRDRNAFEA